MRFRHLPLLVLLSLALLAPAAPASPASTGQATTAAKKVKACKRKQGESKKRWLKRCKCKSFKRGETRKRFKKRCPGAKVPRRKAPSGGGQTPAPTAPAPAPAPIVDPVRNDAGFGEIMGRSDFLRTYQPSPSATHSEWYRFCATRLQHHYEGIAYIYESTGPWRVIEGYLNGDGTKGYGTIEFTQEQANFPEEVGKVQLIKFTWPAPGTDRADVALIEHPEIGAYQFARSPRTATC